jgi:HAD superfamily hydrolase (TIGR01509 family)
VSRRTVPAVAFDLDGLLIDSEPVFRDAARRVLAARGRQLDESFLQTMMGLPGRDALPRFCERFGLSESVADVAVEYRAAFFASLGGGVIPLRPGARPLVERLRAAGSRVVIATSSQRAYVEQVVGPHQILDQFESILTCDDVANGKPAPDIFLLAAEVLDVSPAELVVFEDSPNGVRAAIAAGARCVAVPQEHTPADAVAAADLVVRSLTDPAVNRFLGL